jgi:hypothetical protein
MGELIQQTQQQDFTYSIITNMSANIAPIFSLVPETVTARITDTTTDKTGATTANIKDLVTGATNGTKVTWIKFKHVGNSTAGIYLVWITDTSGSNPRLYSELAIAAVTSSGTVLTNENTLFTPDLQLKSGQKIQVGATTATTNIDVTASIGNF